MGILIAAPERYETNLLESVRLKEIGIITHDPRLRYGSGQNGKISDDGRREARQEFIRLITTRHGECRILVFSDPTKGLPIPWIDAVERIIAMTQIAFAMLVAAEPTGTPRFSKVDFFAIGREGNLQLLEHYHRMSETNVWTYLVEHAEKLLCHVPIIA